jgi:ATP-dependent Clp endopeptidase proteolytic subunit ClpP
MNFQYTVNVESDEPIMLINRHIGFDETDGYGIMGDLFQAELLALDSMGKKRIQVWINSVGGIVMDGYNIFNAILKSKTKVDTYCIGIAASIAGVIFQGGRNRVMSDYGLLMYHNPFGGGESTDLVAMKDSLVKMVSTRSGKTEEEVSTMMNKTSWIGASEAFAMGLCDQIEVSQDHNKKRTVPVGDTKAMWKQAGEVLNSILNTSENMKKVANKLGLNPEASEDAIVSAIAEVSNRATAAEAKVAELTEAQNKSAKDLQDAIEQHKSAMEKCQKELDDLKKKAKDSEEEAATAKAKNMVEGFAKVGKIKNEETVIATWTEKAKEDFDGVKNMLESIPVNKSAAKIEDAAKVEDKTIPVYNAAVQMQMIAARANQQK